MADPEARMGSATGSAAELLVDRLPGDQRLGTYVYHRNRSPLDLEIHGVPVDCATSRTERATRSTMLGSGTIAVCSDIHPPFGGRRSAAQPSEDAPGTSQLTYQALSGFDR